MRKPSRPYVLGCLTGALLPVPLLLVAAFLYGLAASYSPKMREQVAEKKSEKLEAPELPKFLKADLDWTVKTVDGAEVTLKQFEGKAVFLHFWWPECVNCLAELEGIEKLYDALQGSGVEFVSIAVGTLDQLPYVLAEKQPPYPVYVSSGKKPDIFEVKQAPVTFIIAPDGEIVLQKSLSAKWDAPEVIDFMKKLAAGEHMELAK